jgi:cytoskeletal protein CcmA (bactofilin family)
MFSRTSDQPAADDSRRGGLQPVGGTGMTGSTGSASSQFASGTDQTLIGREDRVEGTVRAHKAIRVLGTIKGKLEAPSVTVEEGAKVTADITADEVVVAGEYSGNLVCRQRLEVRPTGRITGRVETQKLMMHEGSSVDGEIHMTKPVDESTGRVSPSTRGYSESNVRKAVASGAEATA